MRLRIGLLVALGSAASASAQSRLGFRLQPSFELGTPLAALPTASLSSQPAPSLRLGVSYGAWAVMADASYSAFGLVGMGVSVADRIRIGLDGEVRVWRGTERRIDLYLVFGAGLVHENNQNNVPSSSNVDGVAFRLGVGGQYFLDTHFSLGLEVGSKTDIFIGTPDLLLDSTGYLGLVGTFDTAG